MNDSFLTAAASYYGLSLDQVQDNSEIDTSTGEFIAVMRILMTPEDLIGVASRMKAMREEEAQRQREQPKPNVVVPTDAQMRERYNNMEDFERSHFGSFGKYKAACLQGVDVTSDADDFGGLPG